jgi:hypothetical protein
MKGLKSCLKSAICFALFFISMAKKSFFLQEIHLKAIHRKEAREFKLYPTDLLSIERGFIRI